MSVRIDLTDESPPRTGLTLPTGSASASSSTSGSTAATPRAINRSPAPNPSSSSASSLSPRHVTLGPIANPPSAHGAAFATARARAARRTAQPQAGPASAQGSSTTGSGATRHDTDDGFVVTGMSESARLAADRARRDAQEARTMTQALGLQSELHSVADALRRATGIAPPHPDSLTVHDGLPPGPHRTASRRLPTWLEQGQAFPFPALANLAANFNMPPIFGPRERLPGTDTVIPAKHDRRMVINHRREQPYQGFSFGIIEPPLDVESFEQDPQIVRGPLPDTSPICAGCDCALVLGGSGKHRMWALPCGHVIDGRCYDRYIHGMSSRKARELAHEEIQQQKLAFSAPSQATGADQSDTREGRGKGKKRTLEDDDDDDDSDERTKRATGAGMLEDTAPDDTTGGDSSAPNATSPAGGSTKGKGATSGKLAKTFRCPVQECVQRIITKPNYPNSAIELFL